MADPTRLITIRQAQEVYAAYLLDRADQYETESPCWVALAEDPDDAGSTKSEERIRARQHRRRGGSEGGVTGRWKPEEDAVLRELYTRGGAQRVARQLGRKVRSVMCRAQVLGIATHRRWSADDDRRLRNLWGEKTVRQLARILGRTPMAVYVRAKVIRLPIGVPDGYAHLTHAAERAGVTVASMRLICERAGVKVRRAMSRPEGRQWRPHQIVDAFEATEAVKAWLETESLDGAARRRRMGSETLAKRLVGVPGVPPKPERGVWRIPSEIIDLAIGRAA